MLPAANRLRTAADFRVATRTGRKAVSGSVIVYLAAGVSEDPVRVGVIVSKSVGGSVQRHRAARRIRGAVAPMIAALPAGSSVVVRALVGADRDPGLAEQVRVGIERVARAGR